MKNTNHLLHLAAIALLIPTTSFSAFNGSDDFNDNSKDTAKWGTDFIQGGGALTETNQRLQFTATGAVSNDIAIRPWIANSGSFTTNWTLQLDVNVPALTLGTSQTCGIGLVVRNGDDPSDLFNVGLNFEVLANSSSVRYFHSGLQVNGGTPSENSFTTTSTSAAVRIRYDAATTTLFAEADSDGAVGGYNFTAFSNQNISVWSMTASSVFQGNAFGSADGNAVITAANGVAADNFQTVPEPSSAVLLLSGIAFCLRRRSLRTHKRIA